MATLNFGSSISDFSSPYSGGSSFDSGFGGSSSFASSAGSIFGDVFSSFGSSSFGSSSFGSSSFGSGRNNGGLLSTSPSLFGTYDTYSGSSSLFGLDNGLLSSNNLFGGTSDLFSTSNDLFGGTNSWLSTPTFGLGGSSSLFGGSNDPFSTSAFSASNPFSHLDSVFDPFPTLNPVSDPFASVFPSPIFTPTSTALTPPGGGLGDLHDPFTPLGPFFGETNDLFSPPGLGTSLPASPRFEANPAPLTPLTPLTPPTFGASTFGASTTPGLFNDPIVNPFAPNHSDLLGNLSEPVSWTAERFFTPGALPSTAGGLLANTTTLWGGLDALTSRVNQVSPGLFQDAGQQIGLHADEIRWFDNFARGPLADGFTVIGNTGAFINGTAESDANTRLGQLWDGLQGASVNHITGARNPIGAGLEAGLALGEQFLGVEVDDRVQSFLPGAAIGAAVESAADLFYSGFTGDEQVFLDQHAANLAGNNGLFAQTAAGGVEALRLAPTPGGIAQWNEQARSGQYGDIFQFSQSLVNSSQNALDGLNQTTSDFFFGDVAPAITFAADTLVTQPTDQLIRGLQGGFSALSQWVGNVVDRAFTIGSPATVSPIGLPSFSSLVGPPAPPLPAGPLFGPAPDATLPLIPAPAPAVTLPPAGATFVGPFPTEPSFGGATTPPPPAGTTFVGPFPTEPSFGGATTPPPPAGATFVGPFQAEPSFDIPEAAPPLGPDVRFGPAPDATLPGPGAGFAGPFAP